MFHNRPDPETDCPVVKIGRPLARKQRHAWIEARLRRMTPVERYQLAQELADAGHALHSPFWGNAIWPLDALCLWAFEEEDDLE